ncbi:MAG: MOSC domain-containing protein [Vicinamibacterales bacterium]
MQTPLVTAVHRTSTHTFSKEPVQSIELVAGSGVVGDAHAGATVKHRSRVAKDPTQPNLRQVHIIHAELFDELRQRGFHVDHGQLGENITTSGLDVLDLSEGSLIALGSDAVLRVTGLRNPCVQIDRFQPGLLKALLEQGADGALVRKAGIMTVVERGGVVRVGDPITVTSPSVRVPLQVV